MSGKGESTSGSEGRSEGMLLRIWRSVFPRPIVPRTERDRRKTIIDFYTEAKIVTERYWPENA